MKRTHWILILCGLPRIAAAQAAPPFRFTDVAYVGATCPATGYAALDNCANERNPPRPSIVRDLEWPQPTDPDVLLARLNYFSAPPYGRDPAPPVPPVPRTELIPHARTTTDGRLLFRFVWPSWISLLPYRPENVQQDWKTGSQPVLPAHFKESLHPFVWLDPRPANTRWTGLNPTPGPNVNPTLPVSLHSTICENNSVAPGAVYRGPRACTATYTPYHPTNPVPATYAGDCYNLTLIVDTSSGVDTWEMRSVDLTVFVPNGKRPDTGESGAVLPDGRSVLVYPQRAQPADPAVTWALPEWNYKDPTIALPNNMTRWDLGYNAVNQWPDLVDKANLCTALQQPNRPNWCEFFDRQRRRTSYNLDTDGNTVRDVPAPVVWSGGPVPGKNYYLFEPVTTGDGRLLVLNVLGRGLMYSYSANPCDIRGWNNYYPISHMPQDPDLIARYEIARAQNRDGQRRKFRDSAGAEIEYGRLDSGAYPWIDRDGKNLFFSAGNNARDGYWAMEHTNVDGTNSSGPVGTQPPPGTTQRRLANPDRGAGSNVSVIGAWTQGKLVVLDDAVNFTDFTRGDDDWRYRLRLYADSDVWVIPKGSQSLNSFENRHFLYDAHNPVMPFDVVWTLGSDTHHNSEVVFDEYHNNRAFVVAHMNSPTEYATGFPQDGFVAQNPGADVRGGDIADFRFSRNPLVQNAATGTKWHDPEGVEGPATLRLRGGARVEPVSMGGVLGKGVYLDGANDFMDMGYKIDPALRDAGWYFGIWIDPRDPSTAALGASRTIFYFPDNSSIALQKRIVNGAEQYVAQLRHAPTGGGREIVLPLVQTGHYFHFGVELTTTFESWVETMYREAGDPPAHSILEPYPVPRIRARRFVQLYVDGTPVGAPAEFVIDRYNNGSGTFGFQPMTAVGLGEWTWMSVGDPGPAFVPGQGRQTLKAWIDELRVYALRPVDVTNPWFDEFICNTALGSLVDVAGTSADPRVVRLKQRAAQYPGNPTVICEQLKLESYSEPLDFPPQYGQRICADRAHKNPDPVEGGRCLRKRRLGLADGLHDLIAGLARPKFSDVAFCTSCHVDDHPLKRHDANGAELPGGLDLSALFAGGVPRYLDLRRQPMNVPATMSGRLPTHWVGPSGALPAPPPLPPATDVYTLDHVFDLRPRVRPNP